MEDNDQQPLMGKMSDWYKGLPDKKKYIEFITDALSVPVLVTVIISNVNSLRAKNSNSGVTPTPTTIIKYVTSGAQDPEKNERPTPTPIPATPTVTPTSGECKKEVGPVDISYPDEGDTITENPVTVTVSYQTGEYCAVVWSYRINGGPWSSYDDKSIALYGMPAGVKKLELKVKSIASGAEKTLTRNFNYQPADQTASPSGQISN